MLGVNKSKIQKPSSGKAGSSDLTEFEAQVATNIAEFQNAPANDDIKSLMQEIYFTSAKQMKSNTNKDCIVITIPSKLLGKFRQVQIRLARELEKKFSPQHVVFVASRTILPPTRGQTDKKRPRSRTLTAVHEAILDDVVHPTEIVGKRTRVSKSGRLLKVLLDPKDHTSVEPRLETFQTVYEKLTGKKVEFTFPEEKL
jgi:small subunit ribosomal protein S7e